jgi:hypothetical protein
MAEFKQGDKVLYGNRPCTVLHVYADTIDLKTTDGYKQLGVKVDKVKPYDREAQDIAPIPIGEDATNPNPRPRVMTSAALPTPEDVQRVYGRKISPEEFKKTFGHDYEDEHERGGYRLVFRGGKWVLYGPDLTKRPGVFETEQEGLAALNSKAKAKDVRPVPVRGRDATTQRWSSTRRGKDTWFAFFKPGDKVYIAGNSPLTGKQGTVKSIEKPIGGDNMYRVEVDGHIGSFPETSLEEKSIRSAFFKPGDKVDIAGHSPLTGKQGIIKSVEKPIGGDIIYRVEVDGYIGSYPETSLEERSIRSAKIGRDVEGFMAGGKFHPVRGSKGYTKKAAGEARRKHNSRVHDAARDGFAHFVTGELPPHFPAECAQTDHDLHIMEELMNNESVQEGFVSAGMRWMVKANNKSLSGRDRDYALRQARVNLKAAKYRQISHDIAPIHVKATKDRVLGRGAVGDGVAGARWVAAGPPGSESYRVGNKEIGSVYLYKGWVGETLTDDKQFGVGKRDEAKLWVERNAQRRFR